MTQHAFRILVAEDDESLMRVLCFKVEKAGFSVQSAHDGLEAWNFACDEKFDLVITDNHMPNMTGTELCQKLADLAGYQSVPIVMLTGKGMEADFKQLHRQLGLAESFVKPFSPRRIVATINRLLTPSEAPTS
jgi:CheY-like chemotaxis protein